MKSIYKSLSKTIGAIALTVGVSLTASAINQSIQDKVVSLDETKGENTISLVENRGDRTVFELDLHSFTKHIVSTERGEAMEISLDNSSRILLKGAPDLPKMATALQVPDDEDVTITVIEAEYKDFENVLIAPSKGNLSRDINPANVPFSFGKEYSEDAFFPGKLVDQGRPYIIRDVRGVSPIVYPFQYNPVTKTLRVYTKMVLEATPTKTAAENIIETKTKINRSQAFEGLYSKHFLNYTSTEDRYTPLDDAPEKMLIISYGSFMDELEPLVEWKRQKGIPTEVVNVSSIGGASQIKQYVKNYYQTNGLTYLLLVGDSGQVPTDSWSIGGGETAYSDNSYGYTVGNDHYLDIFVGRFSAETSAQVTTQVERTIHYERDIQTTETWMENAFCSASAEGGSNGDDSQTDVQHMNHIQTDLENYGYTVKRVDEAGGSVSKIKNAINPGVGVSNYVGHGYDFFWVNVRFDIDDVNSLTNVNKLPFMMNVACVNGKFFNQTCFAEAWLRATHNGQPTGGIAMIASTVNQDWAPPMRAQDEFNDILTGRYSNNVKRTFGGIAVNAIFDMLDHYPTYGPKNADTWTIFGDPSLMVRTQQPTTMSLTHASTIPANASSFEVICNEEGALVSVSKNGELLGRAYVSGGTANINLSNVPASGDVKITATAFNKKTIVEEVTIGGDNGGNNPDPNPTPNSYCDASSSDCSYEWLSKVQVDGFTHTSGATNYSDFTSTTIELPKGESVPVTLTQSYSGSKYTEYFRVWIDYNKDGDFDDAGELVFSGSGKNAVNGSINVPSNASGETRMRISMSDGQYRGACESFTYGEVEDFTVEFTDAVVIPEYCELRSTNKSYEYIKTVEIGSFSKSSSNSYYTDYTSEVINFNPNEQVDIRLTPGFAGSKYSEYWTIWIDYNRDGDFSDSGEKVFSTSGGSKYAVNGTINIPDVNVTTRMRIAMKDGSISGPCGTYTYGEVEDFTVQIGNRGERTFIAGTDNLNKVYPNPATDAVTISDASGLESKLQLFDARGSLVEEKVFTGNTDISLVRLESGVYLIRVVNAANQWNEKVIKR